LKDEMYTYHYYKNRSIVRPAKLSDFFVQATVICGIAYAFVTLLVIFR
jgi:hypothetical protein